MKVCSDCLQCYEDSAISCAEKDHNLIAVRAGVCQINDQYCLEYLIEISDISETYGATNSISKQPCAVKIINSNLTGNQQNLQTKFLTEARFAAAVNHPNAVRIYDSGALPDGTLYVVSEPVDGQTLREFLNNASIPEIAVINIIRQTAEGLEAIHTAEVVHRNVNPENIILVSDAENNLQVKIQNIDFGGIKQRFRLSGIADTEQTRADLRYFSPEQCRTDDEIDALTDVYGLGITLYEMLAGQPPFDAPQAAKIIDKQISEPPPSIKISNFNIRALLTHTLMSALQKTRIGRLKSVNAFARQLRHIEQLTSHLILPSIPQTATESLPAILPEKQAAQATENEKDASRNDIQADTESIAAVQIKNPSPVVAVASFSFPQEPATVSTFIEDESGIQTSRNFAVEAAESNLLPAAVPERNEREESAAILPEEEDEIKSARLSDANSQSEQLFIDDEEFDDDEFADGEYESSEIIPAAGIKENQRPAAAEDLFDSENVAPRIRISNRGMFIGGAAAVLFLAVILTTAILDENIQSSAASQTDVSSVAPSAPIEKPVPKPEEPAVSNVATALNEESKNQPASDETAPADVSELPNSKTFNVKESRPIVAEKSSTALAKPGAKNSALKEVSAAKEKSGAATAKEPPANKTVTTQKPFPDIKIIVGKQTPKPAKTDVLSRPRIFDKKGN